MTEGSREQEDRELEDLATELRVGDVIAALAEPGSLSPPEGVRSSLFERVQGSPRPRGERVDAATLYANRVAALGSLLPALAPDDWSRPVAPYSWSVHGLIAHLLVIERYTARQFGIVGTPPARPDDSDDHLTMGLGEIAAELDGNPFDTMKRWFEAADRLAQYVHSERYDPSASASLHGWPFSQSAALVARAFELWTHWEDIRRAVKLPLETIAPNELRTMSSLSVASLPFVLPIACPTVSMRPTRVVLTGPGGGTFDIGGTGPRVATVVVDVVDYCRSVARRIDTDQLGATIEGDAQLVSCLLDGSRAFAV